MILESPPQREDRTLETMATLYPAAFLMATATNF
jgi:hypothetical protein